MKTEMARPIKEIPTLHGEAAISLLKRAEAAEKLYFESKKNGTFKDITKDPNHQNIMKKLNNPKII